MSGKKLLITGANGFVGSFLTQYAIDADFDTYAGVRASANLDYIKDLKSTIIHIDFTDEDKLRAQLKENAFDFIIHNAGITRAKTQEEYHTVNAAYIFKMCKLLIEENVIPKKLIFTSSLAAYGPADYQMKQILDHDALPHPATMYGKSKLQAEKLIESLSRIPYIILRPTAVFGPREKDLFLSVKSINQNICLKIGKEKQYVSFIYVKDLAELMMHALESKISRKAYFVTDGKLYNIDTYNDIISDHLGKKPRVITIPLGLVKPIAYCAELAGKISGNYPIINRDKMPEITARNWNCDVSPLVKDFNFEPQYTLEEALKETIDWYKEKQWI